MRESWESRLGRWRLNWFPAYRGTGGRATYVSADFKEVHIRLELESVEKLDRHFTVELKDASGEVHAIIEKTINIRKRRPG